MLSEDICVSYPFLNALNTQTLMNKYRYTGASKTVKGISLRQFWYLFDQLAGGLGRIVWVIQGTVAVLENVVAVKVFIPAQI